MTKKIKGLTREDYMALARQGIQLMLSIDPVVLSRIRYLSQSIGVEEWLIMQNIIISEWARQEARIAVNGQERPHYYPEFAVATSGDGSKKLLTGEQLFNTLVEEYKKTLISTKEKQP